VGVEGYTGEMRLMLRDLVDILMLTGMRQGTESMNLEWKHIEWYEEKDVRYLCIWVSGKTGARWLIAKNECVEVLRRLQATHEDTEHLEVDDLLALRKPLKLFRLQDGHKPFEMNKIFRRLLGDVDLLKGRLAQTGRCIAFVIPMPHRNYWRALTYTHCQDRWGLQLLCWRSTTAS